MRVLSRPALFAALLAAAAAGRADEPGPLLKPVVPAAGSARVRVPTSVEKPVFLHFAGKVPKAQGKKGETADVVVAFDTLPGKSYVAAKKWRSWGYEVPANRTAVLPELLVTGVQLAPKPDRGGRDAEVRVANVRLEVVEPPGDADTVYECDLVLSMSELTKGADRALAPRLYFADNFLEFTVPAAAARRTGSGDDPAPPEPAVTPDKDLVAVSAPTAVRNGTPVMAFASLNGLAQYKTPEGKSEAVSAGVSSGTSLPSGILVTLGTARGCGIEPEAGKEAKGIGADFDLKIGRAKVKELRIGFQTGPGLKAAKDLVLRDVTVGVDLNNSGHFVWLAPQFFAAHFKDPVYAWGPDAMWRVHGRVKPDLLEDPKTRTPPKKP